MTDLKIIDFLSRSYILGDSRQVKKSVLNVRLTAVAHYLFLNNFAIILFCYVLIVLWICMNINKLELCFI